MYKCQFSGTGPNAFVTSSLVELKSFNMPGLHTSTLEAQLACVLESSHLQVCCLWPSPQQKPRKPSFHKLGNELESLTKTTSIHTESQGITQFLLFLLGHSLTGLVCAHIADHEVKKKQHCSAHFHLFPRQLHNGSCCFLFCVVHLSVFVVLLDEHFSHIFLVTTTTPSRTQTIFQSNQGSCCTSRWRHDTWPSESKDASGGTAITGGLVVACGPPCLPNGLSLGGND